MVTISVIIPTYNRAYCIHDAVKSVLAQSYDDYEIIVVDDASTDNTQQVLNNFNIQYHKLPANMGVSYARNFAIKRAKGEYLAFLDSDDVWEPNKLSEQINFMKEYNSKICQVGEIWIRNGKRVNPMKKHQKPSGEIFIPSLKLCLVSPSAVMIHQAVFSDIGLFDENLTVCEDYDLWLRASLKYKVLLMDKYLIKKNGGHDDQLSRKFWGMDRFRIQSMEKLLFVDMPKNYRAELIKELCLKSKVLAKGSFKRKNMKIFFKYWLRYLLYQSICLFRGL